MGSLWYFANAAFCGAMLGYDIVVAITEQSPSSAAFAGIMGVLLVLWLARLIRDTRP